MCHVLTMFPLGSAWFTWNGGVRGTNVLDALSKDARHVALLGDAKTGKTSLAFQAAVSLATDDKRVTFVRPRVLSALPLTVHGMPTPEAHALHNVKFWYPDRAEEVVKWCGSLHLQPVLPEVIIVDDLDVFAVQSKDAERGAARLYAALLDVVAWLQQKGEGCRLITTGSQKVASLPAVSRQFGFKIMTLTGTSEDQDGSCTLMAKSSTYNLCIKYNVGNQNIYLKNVECSLNDV